jgi:hypothetical protein
MNNRQERDLRSCPIFSEPGVSIWDNRANMPWPRKGDSLLSDRIGAETYVFPYEDWIPDELERPASLRCSTSSVHETSFACG